MNSRAMETLKDESLKFSLFNHQSKKSKKALANGMKNFCHLRLLSFHLLSDDEIGQERKNSFPEFLVHSFASIVKFICLSWFQ